MPYMHNDTVRIYYELHGSGPPLMLIAGLASDAQSWLPVIPGALLQLMTDAPHSLHTEQPELFVRQVTDFYPEKQTTTEL